MSSNKKNKKSKKGFLVVIIFVLFFAVGAVSGVFGTKYYFDLNKEEEAGEDFVVAKEKEITTKQEYQDTISKLHSYIKNYAEFYDSKGIELSTMDNNLKFRMIYNLVVADKLGVNETANVTYYGSGVCENGFLADVLDQGIPSTVCTVQKYKKEDFLLKYNAMFAKSEFNLNVEYYPTDNKKCVPYEEHIYCGNINNITGITGELAPRFTINKVMIDDDNIYIYDKGYLIDGRSNVPRVEGQTNYYLHAFDSAEHYYELKSADNLTFKHTYRMQEDGKYYYLKTELVTK